MRRSIDEGIGPVVATPIMRWLHAVDGPVDEFNQTLVLQAPAGVSEADVEIVLQALLDRHATLRLLVDDDGAGGWSLTVPEPGSVQARDCLSTAEAFSDEALVAARSGLDPAAGMMLRAVWAADAGQLALIIHHLAVDGVSWRILLEDLNIAWAQHHSGQAIVLPTGGTSFARWSSLLEERAHTAEVVEHAEAWRQVAATPAVLPAVDPAVDTYASAGQMSVSLDVETTRRLLGEVPAAFHAGVQDVLLIAFGLAFNEYLGGSGAPVGIDVEAHGRVEDWADDVDLSRTVGWFTAKYPVALATGGLSWEQVVSGDAALGAVIKDAKEQLRAVPDGLTYGLLRYLNADVDLGGADPGIGFNYLGRLGAGAGDLSEDFWRISDDSLSMAQVASAIPMPLMHTVELNAGTQDTDAGPQLQAVVDLGALGARRVADRAVEPVVVRGAGRDVRPCSARRRWVDPLGSGAGQADPASDRRADRAVRGGRCVAADPGAAGVVVPGGLRGGLRGRRLRRATGHHRGRCTRPGSAARCGARHGRPPPQPGCPVLRPIRRTGPGHRH